MSNFKEQYSIPKQLEVEIQLGVQLSKVVFDQSHSEIKKKMGLPPLVGPEKEVRISPSNQLHEKNILRQPIHRNRIQACTHDGILVIGEQALEQYRQLIEERIRSKCCEDLIEEQNMRKAEKRSAVELCLRKTKERYKNCVLVLKRRFQEKLETELEKSLDECKRKMQEAILQERANITREVLKKMRDEIGFVVTSLYSHFEDNLCAEKQNMIAEFNKIMRHARLKTDATMREMVRKKEEEFQISLEEIKLQKIVDLTYVLCSERMRCTSEKHDMHQSFEKQIETLQKMLLEANHTIKLMKEETFENENPKICETKIIEIVKQFQKFINFAFDAVPGQADFLLSLESLLTLELDQNISERDAKGDDERKLEKKLEQNKETQTPAKKSLEIPEDAVLKSRLSEKNEEKKRFKVLGDDGNYHFQTPEEFTIFRMQSLIRILKLHPSLKHILIPHIGKALY